MPLAKKRGLCSVLLDHVYLQIVKVDRFNEIIRGKTGFVVLLEISDIAVEPDRFPEVELVTNRLKRVKYFVCTRLRTLISDHSVPEHMVVFESSCPQSKHSKISFS